MTHPYKYKFLEHPSDIKIRAYGKTLPEIFVNAALGMMEYIYGKADFNSDSTEKFEVTASNHEQLLINWLAKILAISSIHHKVCNSFTIEEFNAKKIVAKVNLGKAKAYDEIKAVTYHDLSLKRIKNEWVATVVCDI